MILQMLLHVFQQNQRSQGSMQLDTLSRSQVSFHMHSERHDVASKMAQSLEPTKVKELTPQKLSSAPPSHSLSVKVSLGCVPSILCPAIICKVCSLLIYNPQLPSTSLQNNRDSNNPDSKGQGKYNSVEFYIKCNNFDQ